jgi:hypothetical protein
MLLQQLRPNSERYLFLRQTPALLPFPDLTEPQTAFPLYAHPELDPQYIVRLPDVYLKVIFLSSLLSSLNQP